MNKKVIAAGVSLAVIVGAHAAFWVYEAGRIKSSIEQMAGRISKEIGNKNTEFLFSSSEVSGYPFNFTVKLHQPKLTSTGGGEKLELSATDESIIVITNLIGNNYKLNLPSKIDVKSIFDEKEKVYKLEFSKVSPELQLNFSKNILLSKEVPDIIDYLSENLKSLKYSDSGYALSRPEDGAKIASSDKDSFYISQTKTKPNNNTISYNINVENMDNAGLFEGGGKASSAESQGGLWPVTASLDLSNIDEKDESGKSKSVDFVVKNLDIAAASFGLVIKGDIKANGEDILPFGDLSIKIRSYQNMVDYFSGMVSNVLAETKIPFLNIKREKSIDFKKVLFEVASEKSNEDKDILLTFSREKGKSLFVGQKGLMEVIDLIKASNSSEANPGVQATQPAQPALKDAYPVIVTNPELMKAK